MSIWEAILLGAVQGLTEFLPVSSSGHLVILEQLLGLELKGGMLFDVILHMGTLAAIVAAFKKDIVRLVLETGRIFGDLWTNLKTFIQNRKYRGENRYRKIIHSNYRKFVVMILVATVPTAILGYLLRSLVSAAASTLLFPALGLLVTGILLLVVDFVETGMRVPKDVPFWNAFVIGICQGLAVFPGVSRSGTTITACLLSGFNRKFAVKFSFLMSIPAIIGACVLEVKGAFTAPDITGLFVLYCILGAIVAAAVGYFSIKAMLVLVQKQKLRYFSYYCFFVGIAAITANFLILPNIK